MEENPWEEYGKKVHTLAGLQKETIRLEMGDISSKALDTINGIRTDVAVTLVTVTHLTDRTSFLLSNAVLGLTTALALCLLFHLTQFSLFLRAVIWIILASVCVNMVLTYVRHSCCPPLPVPQQKSVNDSANKVEAKTNTEVPRQISERELAKL